jgi:hypothetical protein
LCPLRLVFVPLEASLTLFRGTFRVEASLSAPCPCPLPLSLPLSLLLPLLLTPYPLPLAPLSLPSLLPWPIHTLSLTLTSDSFSSPLPYTHMLLPYIYVQGPNYALAKHFQMWRAVQARNAGTLVSVNMAPGCRTESVTHASAAANALEGQALFAPLLAFDSSEVSCVMAMLLLWDLHSPTSTARPSHPLRNHNDIFLQNNFHGGGIRCPYRGETLGTVSYLAGSMGYKFDL